MTKPAVRITSGFVHRTATLSAQFLLVFLALWALRNVTTHLSYVLIPLFVALLLTALLEPLTSWLVQQRWPRGLAVLASLIVGLVVLGGLVTFVVVSIVDNLSALTRRVSESIEQVQRWLNRSPFQFSEQLLNRAQGWLSGNQQTVMNQAFTAVSTVGSFLVGLVIALVLFVMFMYSGPRMWAFLLRPWRPGTREVVDDAGRRAYRSVVLYVRVTALVALIDAAGIGIGLAVVGVPLTVPLAALVFLGGFVPYVGAVVSGFLAVAVTLVSNGFVAALIILGVVLAVQQLEGQVLQPVLQGNFTNLHPAVVLVALVIGGAEGGIAGVLFAVPVLAAVRGIVLAVADHRDDKADTDATDDGAAEGEDAEGEDNEAGDPAEARAEPPPGDQAPPEAPPAR